MSPIGIDVVPGLDTTAIRVAGGRCYSAAVREKGFFSGAVNSSAVHRVCLKPRRRLEKRMGTYITPIQNLPHLEGVLLRCDQDGRLGTMSAVTISSSGS